METCLMGKKTSEIINIMVQEMQVVMVTAVARSLRADFYLR
jgi:hypothetical protein